MVKKDNWGAWLSVSVSQNHTDKWDAILLKKSSYAFGFMSH